jgi:N-methylhydantoinase B
VVTFGDGDVEPAFGLYGGLDATLNKIELRYPDGQVYLTTTKDLVEGVPEGTVLFQQAGGGGGYGPPHLRDPSLVASEVKNGIISVASAREDYRVILDPETFELDAGATRKLREEIKS